MNITNLKELLDEISKDKQAQEFLDYKCRVEQKTPRRTLEIYGDPREWNKNETND